MLELLAAATLQPDATSPKVVDRRYPEANAAGKGLGKFETPRLLYGTISASSVSQVRAVSLELTQIDHSRSYSDQVVHRFGAGLSLIAIAAALAIIAAVAGYQIVSAVSFATLGFGGALSSSAMKLARQERVQRRHR